MMDSKERIYPCDRCGKLRSKASGGTTFTLCDACWELAYGKRSQPVPLVPSKVKVSDLLSSVQQIINPYPTGETAFDNGGYAGFESCRQAVMKILEK